VTPNQPKTPVKCFRIPEELYAACMVTASARGEVLSTEVRAFLEWYRDLGLEGRRAYVKG
jgi:hypothetical protein